MCFLVHEDTCGSDFVCVFVFLKCDSGIHYTHKPHCIYLFSRGWALRVFPIIVVTARAASNAALAQHTCTAPPGRTCRMSCWLVHHRVLHTTQTWTHTYACVCEHTLHWRRSHYQCTQDIYPYTDQKVADGTLCGSLPLRTQAFKVFLKVHEKWN